MFGAIIGDIVGSVYEWHNIRTKQFPLFSELCRPTDDSIMTLAVAQALLDSNGNPDTLEAFAVRNMQWLGCKYPCAGYGGRFRKWLTDANPQPYNSFGNGSAMRVSPCAYAANSLEEALMYSGLVTCVTHNHPEGIKGANAVTAAIYMARTGKSIADIKEFVINQFYNIDFTLDEIRPSYSFDVSCQGSVPQALEAFFESTDFEDAIRNAVSIGGDSDTIAAITGSIAEAYYGIPDDIRKNALGYLDDTQTRILNDFEAKFNR